MTDIQIATLSLLLFIAYKVVIPSNEKDVEALNSFREYLSEITEYYEKYYKVDK